MRVDIKKRLTKKSRVIDYARSRGWTLIGDAEWKELHASLPDIADTTLRSAGLTIAQPWLGVVQHTLEELEASLTELAQVYETQPDLRRYCREQVIAAKDRARWLSRKHPLKAEMVEWMLVWLGDPSMFAIWADGVKRAKRNAMPQEHRVKCDVCSGTGQCIICKGTSNGGQCFNCAGTGNCPQCQGSGRREAIHVK
jgi:hypothetical protein